MAKENELALNTLQADAKKGGVLCTLDLANEQDVDLLLSTQDNDDMLKVKDQVGQVLEVNGMYVRERSEQSTNEDGEVIDYYKHTTILFTTDGKMYVTGSNAFFMSLDLIATFKGYPTKENPLKIKIVETDAKEKGHKYLKAVIAK